MEKFKKFLDAFTNWDVKKSELKEFINENGFFSKSMVNLLSRDEAEKSLNKDRWKKTVQVTNKVPEWENIFVYEWIISQQYGPWERNRNGYKIDKNWRKLDEYMFNPAILLMHDVDKGVIGQMIKVGVVKDGLKAMFWVDINNVSDEGIKNQIQTWVLKASSTGSLVDEYKFEDMETSKNLTEEEAREEYGWREIILAYFWMSDKLILNVTSAIMIETSLVAIGSNFKAVSDTVWTYFTNLINSKMTPEEKAKLKDYSTNVVEEDEDIVEGDDVTEWTDTNSASEDDLENEGETPEASEEDTTAEAENAETEVQEEEAENAEQPVETGTDAGNAEPPVSVEDVIVTLKAENLTQKAEIERLNGIVADLEKINADQKELIDLGSNRKKVKSVSDCTTTLPTSEPNKSVNIGKLLRTKR